MYLPSLEKSTALAGSDENIFLHNGDECHGNKHPQSLVSTRIADQFLIADANFRAAIDQINPKRARFNMGTGAHNFMEGSSTQIISQMLSARYPDKDISPVMHGLFDIDGFTVDVSHHGPTPGSRVWLEGNEARYYLRSIMMREIMAGRKPPDLVLRAHFHVPILETLRVWGYTSTIMILPPMCMVDDYSRQAAKSPYIVTTGLTGFEIVDGKLLDIHEWHQTTDIRTKEAL